MEVEFEVELVDFQLVVEFDVVLKEELEVELQALKVELV